MYSALAVDKAIVGWRYDFQDIADPFKRKYILTLI
jgi:hypothetical protein